MTDKPKTKHTPPTEEQRKSWRKLWPDLPGGIKQTPLEDQFQREFGREGGGTKI